MASEGVDCQAGWECCRKEGVLLDAAGAVHMQLCICIWPALRGSSAQDSSAEGTDAAIVVLADLWRSCAEIRSAISTSLAFCSCSCSQASLKVTMVLSSKGREAG